MIPKKNFCTLIYFDLFLPTFVSGPILTNAFFKSVWFYLGENEAKYFHPH